MPAPKGNRFWEARSTHGRNPIFENKEQLLDAAYQYFKWVEKHPLKESKLVSFQGESKLETVPLMRAMTIEGLCLFMGISQQTLLNYEEKEDFLDVIAEIRGIVRQQKFEGASAGLLNANIIARDLGLKDNQDLTSGGKPIQNTWNVYPVTTDKDG